MSKTFKVAHIREQGVDLIITPLDSSFNNKTSTQQTKFIEWMQLQAGSAGLAGTVVPVWQSGRSVKFIAPRGYHPFFRSITWNFVIADLLPVD
ncbi:hypothetical protein KK010_23090 [Enterobacter mori]|uniref:hypothetical protein n=1 Tax=Enterobacter mori TaxID=539813 RepID=UPI001BDFADF6|nr:hypothetical protein [Enterobacter mori]MBT1872810.1 hypothetical protein [Enterobacter mori]